MRSRTALVAALVLGAEAYTYARYAAYGAQWHFWLHALLGGWAGLAVLVGFRLLLPARPQRAGPWESGFAGHLWSAAPDVLFAALGLLHARWMDVFGVHVTVHLVPAPLVVVLALWGLGLAAYGALRLGARRAAGALLAGSVLLLGAAVATADPLPASLAEVVPDSGAWWCSVS